MSKMEDLLSSVKDGEVLNAVKLNNLLKKEEEKKKPSKFVIAFAIIEKLLAAQRSHREECNQLRRKLATSNQRTAQQRLQALSYDHAWKKLRDDIAGEEGLSGNEVIHRFRLGIDEYRETLRTKQANKPNKQTKPNA